MAEPSEKKLPGMLPYEYPHTPEQEKMFQELLEAVKGKLPAEPAHIYTEDWVHRFLVARKWDLAAAKAQLEGSLQWRAEFGADTILAGKPPDPRIDKYVARGIHGFSRDGFFVLWERPGKSKYPEVIPIVGVDEMVKGKIYNRETQRLMTTEAGRKFRLVVVIDVEGAGLHLATKQVHALGKILGKVDADNYPEALEKCFIVNASRVFPAIWSIAKKFIDKDVAAKVEILGGDFLPRLTEVIDPKYIPRFAGGECPEPCPFAKEPLRCGDKALKEMEALAAGDPDMNKVDIKAGKALPVESPVGPGDQVVWEFRTETYNVAFGAEFHPEGGAKPEVLVPHGPVESHEGPVHGAAVSPGTGRVVLTFDNKSSRFRGKTLHYRVTTVSSEGATSQGAAVDS
eukprot:NODE_1405_length_1429_cov_15.394928_g1170_i0.p1 GENE.NODE_1405_length_1429_cov_15.394928_g1170_i0~~NODE_1405_length_1429_cov_15.394928_g1170_i0.p1  ORF type:complete len:399 (+),score=74.67 NODE_1405_length_1429_cov_15.394928_g1170_i0:130-1326(+)